MHLSFHPDANNELDRLEANEPRLYAAVDEVLLLLEEQPNHPRLRHHLIRPANAFVVKVYAPAYGDRHYYVFWIPEPNDSAYVKYIGPGDADI